MQTPEKEYYAELARIQDENATTVAVLLPSSEKVYEVDLDSRTIEQPTGYTIVESDNSSETIYFKMPRYYDNVDLSDTVGIVEYINANKEKYLYVIPYYDVDTYSEYDAKNNVDIPMILFPWRIGGTAAAKTGKVTFAFKFYKLNDTGTKYVYNLNTLQQTMTIEKKINIADDELENDADAQYRIAAYEEFLDNAAKAAQEGSLCWIVL